MRSWWPVVLLVIACGDTVTPPPRSPEVSVVAYCNRLDRLQCVESTECRLVATDEPGRYRCRPAVGPCEVGFRQYDEQACARSGSCRLATGHCFCPCRGYGRTLVEDAHGKDCSCFCSGGPPTICVAR